ncbi:MAG: HAD-IC family P-type ATPase [Candidatus Doudnabacteria bacterium]|nr:HAD-IC family P-type ATPase [Candidatus Doudnabacteria bacterium]
MRPNWYAKSAQQIFRELETNKKGLSAAIARKRLRENGPNALPEPKADSLLKIFARQFQSPLIYLLFSASVIVYFIGDISDSIVVLSVLSINAVIGTFQEGRAQNALAALKQFVSTKATVLRDDKDIIISDTEVVVGDIILLHEGDKVPADARLFLSNNLTIDEASLTGESEPVKKTVETITRKNLADTEQHNMIFKGTHVVAGNGHAIVVETGLNTVIGKISETISNIDTEDPLKKSIAKLSRLIIIVAASIASILMIIGLIQGLTFLTILATVVSLSVSIIPEGLPVVITLVLATGVRRMSKQNALVKKLQAVESLGEAQIIAVDKTGTITKNEMTVQKVFVDGKTYDIEGSGYEPVGAIELNGSEVHINKDSSLAAVARYAAYCANARASFNEDTKQWQVTGDPTEASMLVFAEKLGIYKDTLEKHSPLLAELPFSSKTKYHATLHQQDNGNLLIAIGAPEVILDKSNRFFSNHSFHNLTPKDKRAIEAQIHKFSKKGLRVLGIAAELKKNTKTIEINDVEKLSFIGLFGIRDTLRPEVEAALFKARNAGIRVVMITGDHVVTAEAIATEAGIFKKGDNVITGPELDTLTAKQLAQKLRKTSVFARVTPEHKLKIIEAYRHSGKIIAMTGDGVNDAPSLVAADLGVSMGLIGTEVAKEASDIILLDDNFGSIVSAIEEGRSIYKTIKKVILYLFSTGIGEVFTITGALLLALPLPVTPSQIIWLNFVTDGFLVVALGMEPKESGLLQSTFNSRSKLLVDWLMGKRILIMALTMAVGTLVLFNYYLGTQPALAGTIAMTTLAIYQWFNAWNSRSDTKSVFAMNPFSNLYLLAATAIVISLQVFAIYSPFMNKLLHTTPLTSNEWLICTAVASSIILVEEMRKLVYRAIHRKH